MKKVTQKRDKKMEGISHTCLYAISTAFFIAITAIFPLYITRNHYLDITESKASFFLTATGIAAFATVVVLFFTTNRFRVRNYFAEGEPVRRLSVAEWAAIAFAVLAFLSSVFSPHGNIVWMGGPLGRWEGFWVIFCYVLTFFIIARFHKPKRWHFLIFAGSTIILSLYTILQFMDYDILIRTGFFINLPGPETPEWHQVFAPLTRLFRTTLGNVNIVAAYGGFAAVLFAGLFAGEESPWGLVYLIASALAFSLLLIVGINGDAGRIGTAAAMTLTIPYWLANRKRLGKILITLAGWVGVFISHNAYMTHLQSQLDRENVTSWADYWLLYRFTPHEPTIFLWAAGTLLALGLIPVFIPLKKWPVLPMKIAGIALMALAIAGSIVFIQIEGARRSDRPHDMIWQAHEILHGRIEDHFGSNRVFVWRHSLPVITDRPLLGSGPGTFHLAIGEEFQDLSRQRYGVIFDTPHNVYLNTAINLGIPALIAFLIFTAALFWFSMKPAFNQPVLLAAAAAALGYLIQGFLQVDTPIDRPLLWISLGIMAGEIWRNKLGIAYIDKKV